MIKKAIIPMAGKGTRLYPLTYSINKAILPFGNKTIIERQLDLLVNVEIEDVYLIVRPEDDIVSQVGYRYRGLTINYVIQKKPLGLADALQTVAKYLVDEKFLLLLCDVLFDEAIIRRMITCDKNSNKSKIIIKSAKDNLEKYGLAVINNSNNDVLEIRGINRQCNPSHWIIAGGYLLDGSVFQIIRTTKIDETGEINFNEVLNRLALEHKLEYIKCDSDYYDLGTLDGYLSSLKEYLNNKQND